RLRRAGRTGLHGRAGVPAQRRRQRAPPTPHRRSRSLRYVFARGERRRSFCCSRRRCFRRSRRRLRRRRSSRRRSVAMRGLYNARLVAASRVAPIAPMSPSTRTACFARLTAANFCFFLTFTSFFLLPLHVRALGGTERTIGLVMGTSGLAGLVSVLAVGALLDRFGRRIFLLGGIATMSAASGAFLLVGRIGPAIFVLRAVQGLAFAAGFNAASTLAAEFAPEGRRAAALGLFGVSTPATHALAPTLGEQLVRLGGFPALFVAATVCSAGGRSSCRRSASWPPRSRCLPPSARCWRWPRRGFSSAPRRASSTRR